MRFEAKHQQSKEYANVCKSRRNLCLSIGKKLCFHNAQIILNCETSFKKVSDLKHNGRSIALFSDQLQSFTSCSSVAYKGKVYCVGDFIISNSKDIGFKILEIAVNSDEVVLSVGTHQLQYNNSLRLYKIEKNNHTNEMKQIDELMHPPSNAIKFEGHLFIHLDNF